MCGIAGILKFDSTSVFEYDLKKMTDVIAHRGPDGEGHWLNNTKKIGFGHRRLSIIDLSLNAVQPMHYANDRYTITYNGEIYNYIEIRDILIKNGYHFKSNSDTEVLLAHYDFKKEKCLEDLDGMFSFAIWDNHEQILFCARDRFGEKPFHYYIDNNQFIFGSEIKQFWTVNINKRVKESKLLDYVKYGIIDNDLDVNDTFYDNIKRLDAAHYLKIDSKNNVEISRYWDIDLSKPKFNGSLVEASEMFLELLKDSIKLRLRSDVSVGSSLSGGLDSSTIVKWIDLFKTNKTEQNTFSARFKNFEKDEGFYINEIIKSCSNIKPHDIWLDRKYFENHLDDVMYYQDEPFGSASIIAQYAVMNLAKKNNVTVLLDGQGADEYLAGYMPNYEDYLKFLYTENPFLYSKEYRSYSNFHQKNYPVSDLSKNETIRMKFGRYRHAIFNFNNTKNDNQFNSILKNSIFNNSLKQLLRYADRNSMAHSRETRLPFLSHKLVEFVFSLPDHYKIHNGFTKYVLRKSMNSYLPKSICWRIDKIGYETPQSNWLQSEDIKYQINNCSKILNISRLEEMNSKKANQQDWRLLMASKYLKYV